MGEIVMVLATCPTLQRTTEMPIEVVWLIRTPGSVLLGWRCQACEDGVHTLALFPQQVTRLRHDGVQLVDLRADRELVDAQRGSLVPKLGEDEVECLVDELWLDHGDDLVAYLPEALVRVVTAGLGVRAAARRRADDAFHRVQTSMANMRRQKRPG